MLVAWESAPPLQPPPLMSMAPSTPCRSPVAVRREQALADQSRARRPPRVGLPSLVVGPAARTEWAVIPPQVSECTAIPWRQSLGPQEYLVSTWERTAPLTRQKLALPTAVYGVTRPTAAPLALESQYSALRIAITPELLSITAQISRPSLRTTTLEPALRRQLRTAMA